MVDEIGETFVTGRAAQRIMLSLRIRIWAQLQRLSLDYYESEMAGRIMTRMTTDVDQFESLIENGLLSALVAIVTFVGVGVALVVINTELGLLTLTVVVPLALATVVFPPPRGKPLRPRPRADRDRQRRLPGEPLRRARVPGLRARGATMARFHRLSGDYLEARVGAQRLVATYFPFVQFLSGAADAIVLGVGAGLVAPGTSRRRADRLHPLHRHFLLADPAALAGLRLLAADACLGRADRRADGARDAHTRRRASARRRLHGEIALDGVRFTYPSRGGAEAAARSLGAGPADARLLSPPDAEPRPAPEALRGIDLRRRTGEIVALVGETGAGKST